MTTTAQSDFRTAIRYELSDTGTFWSDAELNAAVSKTEGLLSRLIPKKAVKEFTITHEVTAETLVVASSTATCASFPIEYQTEILTNTGGTVTYVRDTDYTINYLTGVVTEIAALLPDASYKISYHKDPQRYPFTTTTLPNLIKPTRIEYPVGNKPASYLVSFDWVDNCLILNGDNALGTTAKHMRVYYDSMWTGSSSADADYPLSLYKACIVGASGNALIYKAEKYVQSAIIAISTLTAPTAPTAYIISAPTPPSPGASVIAPTLLELSFTATETALTAIATKVTAAIAYLTSGAALVNTLTVGDNVAQIYGQYGAVGMDGAGHITNEALARLKQIEASIANYSANVQAYNIKVQDNAQINNANLAKIQQSIDIQKIGYENYKTQVEAYEASVAKYAQQVQDRETAVRNNLDIAGRFLASGQAKINEFYSLCGAKPELQQYRSGVSQNSSV
jgi:hypothetical protein